MRTPIILLAAAALAACEPKTDSSSETHFVDCVRDWECTALGASYACVDGRCAEVDGGAPAPLVPDECRGRGTVCSPVESTPLPPLPTTRCSVSDGGEPAVDWISELGTVDCPVGKCTAVNPRIALAADGSVWAAAELVLLTPLPSQPLGNAVLHFDASGRRISATLVTFSSRIVGQLRGSQDGALGVDSHGNLTSVARAKGPSMAPGYDWQEYDAGGALVTSRRVFERARSVRGFFSGGTLLAEFSYIPAGIEQPDGGPPPGDDQAALDLVALGPGARLLWQQNGLEFPVPLAFDAASRRLLVQHGGFFEGLPDRSMAAVDAAGNTAWSYSIPDLWSLRASAASNGDFFAYADLQHPPKPGEFGSTVELPLFRIDGAGAIAWALDLEVLFNGGEVDASGAVFVPAIDGRVLLAIAPGLPETLKQFIAVSADGARCTTWSLPLPYCLEAGQGSFYCDVGGAPGRGGRYVLTTPTALAQVRFGDLP